MTLTLRPTKTGLRFEYTDDDAETVISIDKADTEADTVRKLKRVIALVEGGEAPTWERQDAIDQHSEYRLDAPAPTNGWEAAYAPPAPPAHWAGQVELIQPGEDA